MFDPRESVFWQAAVRSGLLNVESLTACWDAVQPPSRDDPDHISRRLARQAVRAGLLTTWQATQLLAGRSSGYTIDRYRLRDVIGQGGMGQVFLAQDTRLDRPVALKILAGDRLSRPRAVARFHREARIGARLQHENLVRIYDFGEYKGRYYLVMEYIEGKTIAALIAERGPMRPAAAVRLVRQVALGLEHAHRKGLTHRDVNPHNILVTHEGTAKLADLGLAITQAEEDRVTRDGATVGTFDYVAPEQARNSRAADARSDIYSLGCTLYHMCAGKVPFPSPSLPEKLLGHQSIEPTPLSRIAPGIPEGLSEIVQRMMKKRPDERYATPLEVASALAPYEGADSAFGSRDTEQPLLEPLGDWSEPRLNDAAHRREVAPASYLVKVPAAHAGLGSPPLVTGNPDSATYANDPAAPVLTPDDDFDETGEEVRLILDTDPEGWLSDSQARSGAGSWKDGSTSAEVAPGPARLARFWPWVLAMLVVIVAVLAVILAT
jgi:serine/threonine protein kinase